MKPHSLTLEQPGEGCPVLHIALGAALTPDNLGPLLDEVTARAAAFEGRPFAMMMDTRQVTSADQAALDKLQALEMELAGKGVERIAHVVRAPEMAAQLQKTYDELGYPDLYGTFTDPVPARTFLAGTPAGDD